MWMSHGDRVERCRPASSRSRSTARRPFAAVEDPGAASTACSSTPRSSHTPRGNEMLRELRLPGLRLRRTWTMRGLRRRDRGRAIRAQVERRARHLRALRRRRLVGRGAARPPGHRRPATCIFVDNGVLREGRARPGRGRLRRMFHLAARHRRRARALPLEARPASTDPERKRKIIGSEFIEVFDEEVEAAEDRRAPSSSPGHALPRRHRVGLVQGPVGHDQEPPQRGRAARAHEARAGRAAARALQGRGARARRASSGCRDGDRAAPALPRPGPRHPHPRRGHRGALRRPARRRRHRAARRSAPPGLYDQLWQAFAVLLPVRSVGVMGDERTYETTLRDPRGRVDRRHDRRLGAAAVRAPRRACRAASSTRSAASTACVYDISSKPPATIEWE